FSSRTCSASRLVLVRTRRMPERWCWTRSFPIILRAAAEILTLLQVPLATEKQNALLRCETRTATKRSVTVLRDLTPDAFREELRHANDLSRRYVVNFARGRIFGAGVGHHWPLGGYLEAEDLVLVLDVNEKF